MKRRFNIVAAGLLLTLSAILAFGHDWQYDEVWTFNEVSENSFTELIGYSKFSFANHQLVNSLYFKLIQRAGITHVFFFRLLSLLSFGVFLAVNFSLLARFAISRGWIVVLSIAPYLIFFSLGRGYAPALAAFSVALLFLFRFRDKCRLRDGYIFTLAGILSMLSIFSFLYGFAALVLIYLYLNREDLLSVHLSIQLTLVGVSMGYVYYAGSIVNAADPYIIGADQLIKNGTVGSLIHWFTHVKGAAGAQWSTLLKLAFMASAVLAVLAGMRKLRSEHKKPSAAYLLLVALTIPLLLMWLAHLLFDAQYPLQRAVMYLPYLGLLLLTVMTKYYSRKVHFIPVLLVLTFSIYTNLRHFAELQRPSLKTIIERTTDSTLLVYSHNPNVRHVNEHYNLKAKDQLYQSSNMADIRQRLAACSACWLLLPEAEVNKFELNVVEKIDCRDGQVLIKHSGR